MTFREIMRTVTTFGLAKRFLKNQTNLHLHPVRAMSTEAGNVIAERVGNKGVLTLDRPRSLNALSLSMIRQIYQTLKVRLVQIEHLHSLLSAQHTSFLFY
ncbi:unnamed protein product [Ixodes pacificus]